MLYGEPAQLRLKAEACRRLADMSENVMREALWLDRADYWEQLATKAEKLLRASKHKLRAFSVAGNAGSSFSDAKRTHRLVKRELALRRLACGVGLYC
jgi:hypothetical protein